MTTALNGVRLFWMLALIWLLLLLAGSLYSPPSFISDPGLGFLDLINFSEGGKFQHHKTPAPENANICIEERTTWWSPGQWFFVYLFTATGMPLGVAISIVVFIAAVLGLWGWLKLYEQFQFDKHIILLSGCILLFSRYLYSSFQIYPGANILEFSTAPWLLLLWLYIEKKQLLWQALALLLLIPVSYFVKSSMLIVWLGIATSIVSFFQLGQLPWRRLLVLLMVFAAGKYGCDVIFTNGGLTPFSSPSQWFTLHGADTILLLQHLLFTISGPFLASAGTDDYIRYIFQQPGHVIFNNGSLPMLFIYSTTAFLFLCLTIFVIKNRTKWQERYLNLVLAVTGIFIAFFLYAYLSGKNINAYEESRHYRTAGLLLLPLVIRWIYGFFKKGIWVLPVLLLLYAIPSSVSKLSRKKIISEKFRIPLGEFENTEDVKLFEAAAEKADLVYVVNASLKYGLDHCKTIYFQDDFVSLPFIEGRPKSILSGKTMVFLLPERFEANGKQAAILANFITPLQTIPAPEITRLKNWHLITVHYE